MSRKGKKVGEILVEDGILTAGQIELALEIQKATGQFLGNILVQKGWVTERQLLNALSEQFDIPFIEFDTKLVDWTVPSQYSSSLMNERCCFPFKQDRVTVTAAISDPLDAWAISEIETQSRGRQVQLVLATKRDITQVLEEFRKRSLG